MSRIKRYTMEEIRKMKSRSDVKKFKDTTEKDILEQSMKDPDTPILTDKELKEMKPAKERKRGKEKKDR
ncbi:MAG: hypothetical protein HY080_05630 [Gammaproteobacteria bacterium]|nr:hypothetical protein [Gammaproteobacteria bacterium]